jgi:hypothetical protein
LVKAAVTGIVVGAVAYSLPLSSVWLALVVRSAIVLTLPLVLLAVGCLKIHELQMLWNYLLRRQQVHPQVA